MGSCLSSNKRNSSSKSKNPLLSFPISQGPNPSLRRFFSHCYVPQREEIYLFGGYQQRHGSNSVMDESDMAYFNDLYRFNLSKGTWEKLWDGNALRKDEYLKTKLSHKGKNASKYNVGEDLSEINSKINGPEGWYSNSITYLEKQNALLFMGGIRGTEESEESNFIDVWLWYVEQKRWEVMHTYGLRPDPCRQHEILIQEEQAQPSHNNQPLPPSPYQNGHSSESQQQQHQLSSIVNNMAANQRAKEMAKKPQSTKLIMFGGHCGYTFPNPVYILDLDTMSWIRSEKNYCPMRRFGHTMNWMDPQQQQNMIVFGGCTNLNTREFDNTCWIWNSPSRNWSILKTRGRKPAPRYNHSSCVIHNRMFVYGGHPFHQENYDYLHLLDFESTMWVTIRLQQPILPNVGSVSSMTKQYSFMRLIRPSKEDIGADPQAPVSVFFDVDVNEIILSKRVSMVGQIEMDQS